MVGKFALYVAAALAGSMAFLAMENGWTILTKDGPTSEELLKMLVAGVWGLLTALLIYTATRLNLPHGR